jgi:hypothetical protein
VASAAMQRIATDNRDFVLMARMRPILKESRDKRQE